MQQTLRQEAAWLDVVYSTTLYGGPTLDDGEAAADGAHDANTGSLFAKQLHATLLFEKKGCLRTSGDSCLKDSDPFYQVRLLNCAEVKKPPGQLSTYPCTVKCSVGSLVLAGVPQRH